MLGMTTTPIKTVWAVAGLAMALAGCSHFSHNGHANIKPNKPLVQTNQVYYAPAQTYNLDLNSAILAGKLDLQDSCTPEGNSLNITDQIGRFYRVDAINLNNNSKLPSADTQDIAGLSSQIGQLYSQLYDAQIQPQAAGNVKAVRSNLGEAGYLVLNQNNQRFIGMLIQHRGQYAYVIQHTQTQYNEKLMLQSLGQLAKNMQIPGRQLKGSDSEMALSIDLASATPAQLADWKKTAQCS